MASISDIGIPGVSTGILHPMRVNQFRVIVSKERADGKTEYYHGLGQQVISISQVYQSKHSSPVAVISHGFHMEVEDDVTCLASKALQTLYGSEDTFQIKVDMLDGCESVIRSTIFKNCTITALCHGALDYAGGTSPRKSRLTIPMREGSMIEDFKSNPITASLVTLLNGAVIDSVDDKDDRHYRSAIVTTRAYISFETMSIEHPVYKVD